MSRSKNAKVTSPVPATPPIPHFVINRTLFGLLKEGKTNSVMSWKVFDARPAEIRVSTPGSDDEIIGKVINMHRCFHGFRPLGFPESEASRDRSTVFDIEIIQAKTVTDGPVND